MLISIKWILCGVFMAIVLGVVYVHHVEAVNFTVQPGPVGCVKVFNAGQQLNGQTNIRFYNACPERLYINACVLDTNGKVKLYQSGSRVLTNGNFTIMTFPDQIPALVSWTADPYSPIMPDLCKKSG
jgi:hypothetical protein